jgi:L-ascorbate metabolism protein UlaG (beta-lactamase superfamily)
MSSTTITRVTYSCHLIEIGGRTILTDPWFTTRPDYYPCEPLACTVEELPDLDAVLITHEHYDHCDLDALKAYRNLDVPVLAAQTVVEPARAAGFTDVRALEPWQSATLGPVTVTATPALHGVYEITFVIGDGSTNVYFAGDTLLIPQLYEVPQRVGPIDVMLMPTNGSRIRPMHDMQVVMSADQAAELVAAYGPQLAIPHHYAFTSGPESDRTITKSDRDPQSFVDAVARLAPKVEAKVVQPGTTVTL